MSAAPHPGKYLKAALKEKNLSYGKAAGITALAPQHLHMLATSQRNFTVEVACKLERGGIGVAENWLYAQAVYDMEQWKKSEKGKRRAPKHP